jgi:hypothetical protein
MFALRTLRGMPPAMTNLRRLAALAVTLTALTLLPTQAAQAGWPDPPGKRVLARGCVDKRALTRPLRVLDVCVPPVKVRITRPALIPIGFTVGKLWCLATNTRPGPPVGTVLSHLAAARFCRKGSRGWAYVRVIT